jgi:hypothetical protein
VECGPEDGSAASNCYHRIHSNEVDFNNAVGAGG